MPLKFDCISEKSNQFEANAVFLTFLLTFPLDFTKQISSILLPAVDCDPFPTFSSKESLYFFFSLSLKWGKNCKYGEVSSFPFCSRNEGRWI